ncbi:MAG: hypothetical protein QOE51_3893 [Actinoplanes sp.]|jgi:hypothetical protein|nr:hypothetical protein [Actinoplanes sp.]
MHLRELAEALEQAEVDPVRYVLPSLFPPGVNWTLWPEGCVWLIPGRDGRWQVEGGGIAPHYNCEGTLCSYDSEEQACEAFLRELTGPGEAFAAERARFSADCVRIWWEDEVRIALEEPDVATERVRWRTVWGEREAAGEPAMTIAELVPALVKADFRRDSVQIEGLDEIRPDEKTTARIGRDEQGRWYFGKWEHDGPERFVVECRFDTEGEFCRHFYDNSIGPVWMTPVLTLAQWRQQREVAAENHAAYQQALQRDKEAAQRRLEEPPATPFMLGIRLDRRGVRPERYWIAGDESHLRPDALFLRQDPQSGEWWVEERLPGGRPTVLRRFTSQTEAFAVFEREMTRTDAAPFAAEKAELGH